MLLDLSSFSVPMELVYELSEELKVDPTRVAKAHALTLDPERPQMGLAGRAGLFASADWWDSIAAGRIRTRTTAGTIAEIFFAGQEARWGDEVNSFALVEPDGGITAMSIPERLSKRQKRRFVVGAQVAAIFAHDELKRPAPDGSPQFSRTLLEMAVSR